MDEIDKLLTTKDKFMRMKTLPRYNPVTYIEWFCTVFSVPAFQYLDDESIFPRIHRESQAFECNFLSKKER